MLLIHKFEDLLKIFFNLYFFLKILIILHW